MRGKGYIDVTSGGGITPERKLIRALTEGEDKKAAPVKKLQISLITGRVRSEEGETLVGIGAKGTKDALLANMAALESGESVQLIAMTVDDAEEFVGGILEVIKLVKEEKDER